MFRSFRQRRSPPSLQPARSLFFLSDQIEFAKGGIPASFPGAGGLYVGKQASYGQDRWDECGEENYH